MSLSSLLRTDTHTDPATSIITPHNNTRLATMITRLREMIREPAAEFLGVLILVVFGTGGNCQAVLSSSPDVTVSPRGSWLSLTIGWAVGVSVGVWISGSISGGHINPAVTLALATRREFPWKKVPVYILAQLLGGIIGAALVYANYFHAIDIFEGGTGIRTLKTAGLFGTFPLDYMSNVSAFFSEFLATALLLLVLLALTDKRNHVPEALLPLALFVFILGIGSSLGMETGFAINPARDFGPRILSAMAGYSSDVWSTRNQYWLWCPILAPVLGGQVAAVAYDVLFGNGREVPTQRDKDSAQDSV